MILRLSIAAVAATLALGFVGGGLGPPGAAASPHPRYGGELKIEDRTRIAGGWPCPARDASTWIAALNAHEPLYRAKADQLEPILAAGPFALDDGWLEIPVRPEVETHDGRSVDAAAVARWLDAIDALGCALLSRGLDGPARVEGDTVRLPWAGSRALAIRALEDPALRWFRPDAMAVGTGPFERSETRDGLTLGSWPGHRAGRPYLDAVLLQQTRGRFGLRPDAQAAVVFAPDGPFEVVWYLAVGPRLAARYPDLAGILDGSIDRRRLLGRFRAEVPRPEPALPGPPREGPVPEGQLSLLVPTSFSADVVERLQLALVRRGLRVIVERRPGAEVDARRAAEAYDLILDHLVEPVAEDEPSPGWRQLVMFAPKRDGPVPELPAEVDGALRSIGVLPLARGRLAIEPRAPAGRNGFRRLDLADVWWMDTWLAP